MYPWGSAKKTRFQFETGIEEVEVAEKEAIKKVTYTKKVAPKKDVAAETLASILS